MNYETPDNFKNIKNNKTSDNISENVLKFASITTELFDTYKKKNCDYGDSFTKSLDEWGLQAAAVRMDDKMNRFKNIIQNGSIKVKDETLIDTLKDLANYCIMTVIYLETK